MRVGSLFSGGGLGDFGFMAAGMEIAWQCEIDEYCQKILALRYPESKKYHDIKTLKGKDLEPVDIIAGGFPCQPFSVAGRRAGKDDNRYLWPEMLRVIKECKPRWIVGENVPGIINMALDTVCSDLESEGYEVWPIVFPSNALGAWHKRDRLWIICYFKSNGTQGGILEPRTARNESFKSSEVMANATSSRQPSWPDIAGTQCEKIRGSEPSIRCETLADTESNPWRFIDGNNTKNGGYWQFEPNVGRVANGITDRVHRLKMLGNGQVPACTYAIGKMIMEIENDTQ